MISVLKRGDEFAHRVVDFVVKDFHKHSKIKTAGLVLILRWLGVTCLSTTVSPYVAELLPLAKLRAAPAASSSRTGLDTGYGSAPGISLSRAFLLLIQPT